MLQNITIEAIAGNDIKAGEFVYKHRNKVIAKTGPLDLSDKSLYGLAVESGEKNDKIKCLIRGCWTKE